MATPINAPMAGEIWHLSIEDLFQPVQDAARLGGDGPFVINLSVSTAPISVPTKAFTNSRLDAHVYQIQVSEDGRTRYRLRLGPFASEDEADAILTEVRDTYPGALTATASASDLRVIANMQAKVDQRQSSQKQADLVIERSVSQKIAAERVAPESGSSEKALPKTQPEKAASEKAALEMATPEKPASAKAAVEEKAVGAKTDAAEISIDIAWPTPALVVPPSAPLSAAIRSQPTQVVAPAATARQWELPELDVPLQTIPKRPAVPIAPVLNEAVTPPKPIELQLAPPFAIAGVAPVLTEVVTPTKKPSTRIATPMPAVIAAPTLTEVMPKTTAVAPSAPTSTAIAATPVKMPPKQAINPPPKQTMMPPPSPAAPKNAAPVEAVKAAPKNAASIEAAKPAPKNAAPIEAAKPAPKNAAPIEAVKAAPKNAAPIEAAKSAPVTTQSVAPARRSWTKSWAKSRALPTKPVAGRLTSLQHVVVATAPAPAPREVKKLEEPLESLESTQTIRALTPMELEDAEASRWFVIQLALADKAFDPDAVPNLDIFSEYRLYWIRAALCTPYVSDFSAKRLARLRWPVTLPPIGKSRP
jgi:SPOR domain